jgi:hypothetical protein
MSIYSLGQQRLYCRRTRHITVDVRTTNWIATNIVDHKTQFGATVFDIGYGASLSGFYGLLWRSLFEAIRAQIITSR